MPTTACIKGGVSIVNTTLPGDIGARLDPSDDTATAVSYLSIRQATHNVIANSVTVTAAAAAAAHNWPPLDSGTYLDTECCPCARNSIADSGQNGRGSIAKAVTDGAYTDGEGKGSGTRTDARTASVSATDTIADAYRKPAPGGTPGGLLCML